MNELIPREQAWLAHILASVVLLAIFIRQRHNEDIERSMEHIRAQSD